MADSGLHTTEAAPEADADGRFLLRLDRPVAEVIRTLRETLARQGFCVAAEVDLQVVVRVRAHACLEPYVVLAVLDGRPAAAMLELDRGIGRLLPWHVVVRADRVGHGTVVEAPDPARLTRYVDRRAPDPRLLALAGRTRDRLARALADAGEQLGSPPARGPRAAREREGVGQP